MLLVFITASVAQKKKGKASDLGRILIGTYLPYQMDGVPKGARKMLENKLNQTITKNGMGGVGMSTRFVLTATVNVLSKDLTATAPPMTALNLDVTLYVGDGVSGALFGSETLQLKGVGKNETKAYISAFKRIKPANPSIQGLLANAKDKIIEYYNGRCDFILKEAKTLEDKGEYEAAMLKLTSVPEVCQECYEKCMDKVVGVFKKQINKDGKVKLAKAKSVWAAGQDYYAASEAGELLSQIDPESESFPTAQLLFKKIEKSMKAKNDKEWNFLMKVQQDDVNLKKSRIQAAKEVGVAYGNNQPKNVTYKTSTW